MQLAEICGNIFIVVMSKHHIDAGVAEWQTHQTQNLTGATPCRFKSGHRHDRPLYISEHGIYSGFLMRGSMERNDAAKAMYGENQIIFILKAIK